MRIFGDRAVISSIVSNMFVSIYIHKMSYFTFFTGGFLSVVTQEFCMMVIEFIAVGHIWLCKLSHVLA